MILIMALLIIIGIGYASYEDNLLLAVATMLASVICLMMSLDFVFAITTMINIFVLIKFVLGDR